MMNNLELEIEKTMKYFDVIYSLIRPPFQVASLTKLVFLSLSINNLSDIRSFANRRQNVTKELMSNLSNVLNHTDSELNIILDIIDKLNISKVINIKDDQIKLIKNIEKPCFSPFLNMDNAKRIINEICKLSNLSFMEEVIKYV